MKRSKLVLLLTVAAALPGCAWLAGPCAEPTTGILGALEAEVAALEAEMTEVDEVRVQGLRFVTGRARGRRVVVARTGIGKVNAALTATLLVERFGPDEVIFSGIAGGLNPDLLPGDVVIARKTAQHDLGTLSREGMERQSVPNPLTGEDNPVFFRADPRLLAAAKEAAAEYRPAEMQTTAGRRTPRTVTGLVVTGDVFVASREKTAELRQALDADAVEMEGAAVAQVCWQFGVPCLVVRSVSDRADEEAGVDLQKFLQTAAQNSAGLVLGILEGLEARRAAALGSPLTGAAAGGR
ncbi:MAG: 5'-methylthioadenosine/adenosylhomocysteine nucleosidase [Candidatus Brocadiaceae bacterium]|jgi:adenosylhomocysteine nucleosidase